MHELAFRRMHNKKYEKYRVENKAVFVQSVCTLSAQTIKTAPLNAALTFKHFLCANA